GLRRRGGMRVAILDERIDIGEPHLVGAGRDASDRLERARRLVDRDLEPFPPKISPVLGEKKCRSQSLEAPIERKFDRGLCRGPPRRDACKRRPDETGAPIYARAVEEAHCRRLSVVPRTAPP